MTTFTDLDLAAPILSALEAEGYSAPTPIQAAAIPAVKDGKDLLGIAQTGTGKTAAFALPILHRLAANPRPAPRKGCRALILSPTRELATQIGDSFRAYGRNLNLNVAVIFGGVAHRPQINALARGLDVLVATPGRLIDHMMERNADIRSTEILVLDEADQMLDLGFIKPIRRIIGDLSQRRQTLLFSATMPDEIAGLVREFMNEPVRVAVTPVASTAERVSQRVIHVSASVKRNLLAELLADEAMARTLVFTRTKRGADRVAKHLEAAGISAAAIHGNKSQKQREMALDDFRTGSVRVLVATDIAARGIDIDGVSHVVNFELPEVPEAYVHRIGRTARAGASGSAISLCDREERDLLFRIEKLIRQRIPSEMRSADSIAEPVMVTPAAETADGGAGAETAERPQNREHHRAGYRGGRGDGRGHGHGGGERGGRHHRGERHGGGDRRSAHEDRSGRRESARRDGDGAGRDRNGAGQSFEGRAQEGRSHEGPARHRPGQVHDRGRDRRGSERDQNQGGNGHRPRRERPAEARDDQFPDFGATPTRPGGHGAEGHRSGEGRSHGEHRSRGDRHHRNGNRQDGGSHRAGGGAHRGGDQSRRREGSGGGQNRGGRASAGQQQR